VTISTSSRGKFSVTARATTLPGNHPLLELAVFEIILWRRDKPSAEIFQDVLLADIARADHITI
jgi:hypothetical protein